MSRLVADSTCSALVSFAMKLSSMALLFVASAGLSGCWGSGSTSGHVENRLIVLDHSIGGIRLDEPRGTVEKSFGHGTSRRRGVVSYFGGRLVVNYWFHEQLTTRVEDLETSWSGFHTRSGIHVGSSREELRALHVVCSARLCGRAGPGPDAPGTGFTMRHGKVAQIYLAHR